MSHSPNRVFAIALGLVYFAVGIFGFFYTSDITFFGTQGAAFIGLFGVNPFLNLIHLVLGVALLLSGLIGPMIAKLANTGIGALFLLAAFVGLFISWGDNPLNVFAFNGADLILHLVTAVILLAVGLGADPIQRAAKSA
jgi:hypothetical protein